MKKLHIILGISGGVDSSVAALLLKQQGHHVEAVFMQNWDEDNTDPFCTAEQDLSDARIVCDQIGIPLHTINFTKEYKDNVFNYFLDEYAAGRTPNPDILCNKEIKFKAFLDYAVKTGADKIATGHYSRCEQHDDGYYYLKKGIDSNKDQTYFLYTLGQDALSKSVMPIGELHKPHVRKIAEENKLATYKKKDSTGICFIGERRFSEFLSEYLLTKPGDIITIDGNIIGKHQGIMFYTIGQRQGLGIGGQKGKSEAPWYVAHKNVESNILTVVQDHDHPLLLSTELSCTKLHWVTEQPSLPFTCKAKTRYRQKDNPCIIESIKNGQCLVTFKEPQWAATPGQSIVFYDNDICLGGGVII